MERQREEEERREAKQQLQQKQKVSPTDNLHMLFRPCPLKTEEQVSKC